MAMWWSIMRLLVRASRSATRLAAATDRLGRARFTFRLRARAHALRELGPTLCARHAQHSRALLSDSRTRDHRSRRYGEHRDGIRAPHRNDARFCGRARLDN